MRRHTRRVVGLVMAIGLLVGMAIILLALRPGAASGKAVLAQSPTHLSNRTDRPHTVRLTLATHNIENLFDVFDDPYTRDESAYPKSNANIRTMGRLLNTLDADVVALQELENVGILSRVRHWHLKGRGYDYMYCNYRRGVRGINNGFIGRVPIGPICVYKYQTLTLPGAAARWTFARDVVCVELRPATDVRVELFILHLKSKRDSAGDPQSARYRLAEARYLRNLLDEKLTNNPAALIAMVGDFNDTPDSAPVRTLIDGGRHSPAMVDCHAHLPAEQRITYLREPYRSTVDYILASPALARHLDRESATVYNQVETGSDHAPLVAGFDLPTTDVRPRQRWPWALPLPEDRVWLDRSQRNTD